MEASKTNSKQDMLIDLKTREKITEIAKALKRTITRSDGGLRNSVISHDGDNVNLVDRETEFEVATQVFAILLDTFADTFGADVLAGLLRTNNETPQAAKRSVVTWIKLIAPLIDRVGAGDRYAITATDLVHRLESLRPELDYDIFRKVTFSENPSIDADLAIAKLEVIRLGRRLIQYGYTRAEVDAAMMQYVVTSWDTISRWEKSARRAIGDEKANLILAQPVPIGKDWAFNALFISVVGAEYRRLKGQKLIIHLSEQDTAAAQALLDLSYADKE